MNYSTSYKFFLSILISLPLLAFSLQGTAKEVVASGEFTGASDHITTGGVSVIKTDKGHVVVLGSDFSLDGAPDPKVGFGKDGKYDIKAQLAKLKSKTGEQRYLIPTSVNVNNYNEVYIWCEKFSVPLGVAELK